MRPKDTGLAEELTRKIIAFDSSTRHLPGIRSEVNRQAFVGQLVESVRRVRFVSVVKSRDLSPLRMDPASELFDPIRAAMLHHQRGNIEEATWLVFLSVHFGKNRRKGWTLVREVYEGEGRGANWTWIRIRTAVTDFRKWLSQHETRLKECGSFGNHRKYENLAAYSGRGTGQAIATYVAWVMGHNGHVSLFRDALERSHNAPRAAFDHLFKMMSCVASFGRTAKFDYLTMLGKLGIVNIEPGSTYMSGSTGPYSGACLLFGGELIRATADKYVVELDASLGVGMQAMEDALCNWQKSPDHFKAFRG